MAATRHNLQLDFFGHHNSFLCVLRVRRNEKNSADKKEAKNGE
jgi:hypothetical protein